MRIVVNDANVLIDLVELKLLPHFFDLTLEFHATSIIINELYEHQQDALAAYIDNGSLQVYDLTGEELEQVIEIRTEKPTLSEQDCAAFYQARSLQCTLLTSDNSLRKYAKEYELDVHGHLWIFDRMVEEKTITPKRASEKLKELCELNTRLGLPKKECDRRHQKWLS